MISRSSLPGWLLAAALAALAGCAHYPLNQPLEDQSSRAPYVFNEEAGGKNTNELFVCLTFSGGGTRAAALSYGVLQKLRDARIVWKGQEKSLLDEVDCISSVSGGSFTAAYYGLFGERLFVDFRERFLEKNIQGALVGAAASPANWFRLASPTFNRIDLAAEYYDQQLFQHKTFRDLGVGGRRPYVIINATNLANGERFEFTQAEFNILGSDLASYPVARAVAASSAFPILLSPLSLKNYPAPDSVKVSKDMSLAQEDFYRNRRRYQWAKNRADYVDEAQRPYLHLMDGGLADNIGLRPIDTAVQRSSGFIRKLFNDGKIEKFVIIVVNARVDGQEQLSKHEAPPGVLTVAYKTATIALDNYSFESIERIKELRDQRRQAQRAVASCQAKLDTCPDPPKLAKFPVDLEPFVVDIDFDAVPDPERRRYFHSLPTSFALSKEQVQKVIDMAGELLEADPEYQALLQSLRN
ncbi:MAG TPA: patatin-like phospholipase family protein [Steroidobacteraceae bacterium]|nr:patatin-like phospholipase family protein [Steroidobacteraceae bacterium]